MADKQVRFNVVADFKKAIKEWEWLRDNVADTTDEYKDAQKAIKSLEKDMAKFTGAVKNNAKEQRIANNLGKKSALVYKGSTDAIRQEITALKGQQSALATNNKQWLDYQMKIMEAENRLKKLTATQSQFNSVAKSTGTATKTFSKSIDGVSKSSGAASAATLELGRVISDAPYGVRGIANNVSQFASQIAFMSRTTDVATGKAIGLSGAIKGVWASIMGPLGVLLAIQAVIAALDFFVGGAKKAEDSLNSLSTAISQTASDSAKLDAISEVMSSGTSSVRQQENALKELKSMGYDPLNESIGEFISKQKELVVLEATSKVFAKELEKLVEQKEAINKLKETLTEDVEREDTFFEKALSSINLPIREAEKALSLIKLDKVPEAIAEIEKSIDKSAEKYKDNYKKILDLMSNRSNGSNSSSNDLETDLINLQGVIDKYNKISVKAAQKSKEKEIESLAQIEKDNVQRRYDDYIANLQKEFEASKKTEKDKEVLKNAQINAEAQRVSAIEAITTATRNQVAEHRAKVTKKETDEAIKAKEREEKEIRKLQADTEKINNSMKKQSLSERIAEHEERIEQILEELRLGNLSAVENARLENELAELRKRLGEDDLSLQKEKLDNITNFIDKSKELVSGFADFLDGEFQRELTIEQNKTNALNNQLNERLLNEKLSKNERKSIQTQIAQNDEALRKKQEVIAKKRFKTDKMFRISMAIADTASGALKAYLSQLVAFDPTSIIRAKAAAATTAAFGLMQVATIARQKFQSSAGSAPIRGVNGSGGNGDGGGREFDFNLVGSSGVNQLSGAIGSQLDRPIKTYVVSKEISTQQELDLSIQGSAKLGG